MLISLGVKGLKIKSKPRPEWSLIHDFRQALLTGSFGKSPESNWLFYFACSELLRVIDSLQLTATKQVATPADWEVGCLC